MSSCRPKATSSNGLRTDTLRMQAPAARSRPQVREMTYLEKDIAQGQVAVADRSMHHHRPLLLPLV
jgi:hypothetical protein